MLILFIHIFSRIHNLLPTFIQILQESRLFNTYKVLPHKHLMKGILKLLKRRKTKKWIIVVVCDNIKQHALDKESRVKSGGKFRNSSEHRWLLYKGEKKFQRSQHGVTIGAYGVLTPSFRELATHLQKLQFIYMQQCFNKG